jgi:trehalose/maltose hydrolase-like predicted phosphorylase
MNPWVLAYDGFDPPDEGLREALCTLGNGYLATRGAAPEAAADAVHYPGTYVAGCYNRLVSRVAGREVENEDLVSVPNWLSLTVRPQGGRWLDLGAQEVLAYRQELDLRRGVLTRRLRVRDHDGKVTGLTQRRFVSMDDPHLAGLETTVMAENWSGPLEVRSALDGRVVNAGVERYRALDGRHLEPVETGQTGDDLVWLQVQTRSSVIRVAQAATTRVVLDGQALSVPRRTEREPGYVVQQLTVEAAEGEPVTVEKLVALFTSKDRAIAEAGGAARKRVGRLRDGFDGRLERHVLAFLSAYGAEMLLEIARFWASMASYSHALDRYEIRGVMGPDEYHDGYPDRDEPGLDNNAYTNVMAAWVLCRALDTLGLLPEHRRTELTERLGLRQEEIDRWEEVSRKLRVCFHDGDIISQFEGYDELEELDWEGLRARHGNIRRLDRILEAEGDTPNRYKASKQADVLMLFYLLSAEELRGLLDRLGYRLEPAAIPRNVDYYLKRTSHGSTLSGVVNAWVLARSDRARSWRFFTEALASDLHDTQGGTSAEGIHLGAMAGTVDLAQRCYSGLETRQDVLWLSPSLPEELDGLGFDVRYRGHWGVNLHLTQRRLRVQVAASAAAPIKVGVDGQVVEIPSGGMREFAL